MSERTLQALRGRINARLQTSAISRDRASAAGREVVAQCRQSDVETLEWVLSEIDAALATAEPRGEAGGDSTDCPTCGDELAVYWEEGRIRGVVSLDQPARAALLRTPRGEGEAAAMSANLARALAAMQAAWIEWRRGRGADAAMQWIENTLIGPGLIPGDDESDAQAFFDRAIAEIENHQIRHAAALRSEAQGEGWQVTEPARDIVRREMPETRATVREAIRAARRGEGGGE